MKRILEASMAAAIAICLLATGGVVWAGLRRPAPATRPHAQQEGARDPDKPKQAPVITDSPLDAPMLSQMTPRPTVPVTSYTLPPDKYAKARRLNQIGYVGRLVAPLYQILILFLILRWGWSARFRDLAVSVSSFRLVQASIYAGILFFVLTLFQLPLDATEHWIFLRYDLSVQGWGSWLWDQTKGLMVLIIIGSIAVWLLFAGIRRCPRRWWLYAWGGGIVLATLLVFLAPVVIDPLFNKFEPLAVHDAPLAQSLEQVVNRAGLVIPENRMFWMKASEKVKTMNAYVTGIGTSKRVVVWDTTIANATLPEILFVFGHEMGHYVLHHLPKGMAVSAAIFLVLFYAGFRWSLGLLRRHGAVWRVRGPEDFAALPVYLGCLLVLVFICTPLLNAVSRYYEHQADQYGLEITHGLTPDSGQVAARTFELLGTLNLEDPAPTRLEIWWYYDHPSIGDRIRFSLEYDPWAQGKTAEFVQ